MRELISRNSTGRKVLLLFILTNLVYILMVAITIPKVMQFANGMKLLDMMPGGYNFDYVNELFTTLGEIGRDAYLYNQIPFDMVYPLLFALSYSLLLAFFLKKLNKLISPLFYFCYLPFIGGTADYLENIGIISLLKKFPEITPSGVKITNLFSQVKSAATSVYFVVLLIIMLWVGIVYINRKRKASSPVN